MGRIISEDATNIFFPQTCDVLVDDIRGITVVGKKGQYNKWFNNSKADLVQIRSHCGPSQVVSSGSHSSSNPQWGPVFYDQSPLGWLLGGQL